MANDVNRLIDMLYERIEDAKSPALKPNMSMVDRDELLDLLDELRAQLPVEIKRAQELLSAGIEVGYSKEVKTGFKVGAKEGGYYISFSDADFDALLGEYLREKVSDMLFKA